MRIGVPDGSGEDTSDGRESIQVRGRRLPVEARGHDERAETEIEQASDGFLGVADDVARHDGAVDQALRWALPDRSRKRWSCVITSCRSIPPDLTHPRSGTPS